MKKIVFSICLLLTGGCAHESTISNIDVGMSRADIVKIIGRPDADKTQGVLEQMTYHNRRASRWRLSRQNYTVVLLNDAVVQITPYPSGQA